VKASPEQLSLPLFECSAADDRPQNARQSEPIHHVVPSRSQSQPSDDAGHAELEVASAAPALLTTQEAAVLLHVHPRTVQRLVERGELSAVHLGAAVRFDPTDVADLTSRLKQRVARQPTSDVIRPSRAVHVSFADRLRSQQHEHRADQA
jgi:excisionase family DNA binding protein